MKDSKMHQGHRQRLKDRARKNGLEDFNIYESLELLLTYPIMFKDTNEIAHRLLLTYGSFANIVDTPREDLLTNKGIGEEAALFLNLIKDFSRLYETSKNESIILNTTDRCVKYFRESIGISNVEEAYMLFMDKNDKLVKTLMLSQGNEFATSFSREKLRNILATVKAKTIVLIHTHPTGSVIPSAEDIKATEAIASCCEILGFELSDHIIMNKKQDYSFRGNNILLEIKANTEKNLSKSVPINPTENIFETISNRRRHNQ